MEFPRVAWVLPLKLDLGASLSSGPGRRSKGSRVPGMVSICCRFVFSSKAVASFPRLNDYRDRSSSTREKNLRPENTIFNINTKLACVSRRSAGPQR